jgi:hypothetical protein
VVLVHLSVRCLVQPQQRQKERICGFLYPPLVTAPDAPGPDEPDLECVDWIVEADDMDEEETAPSAALRASTRASNETLSMSHLLWTRWKMPN